MFENLVEILKKNPRKIVYTEGTDARILESAARLKADGFLTPVLVGNVEDVKAAAAKGGFDIEGLEIIDPENYDGFDAMVEEMVKLRKGKMSAEDCAAALKKSNYFGTMLVKMGKADALLGGATYSTADTVRPALQLVKTKPGAHLVSSCFIMVRGDEMLAMGDCAINIDYTDTVDKDGNVTFSAADKLAETGIECARTAKVFGIEPKVAFLSYSTKGPPSSTSTARCSLTPPCPPPSASSSSRAARSPATPTPSSSRRSSPATSATRSPSAWAASTPTAPSCRA